MRDALYSLERKRRLIWKYEALIDLFAGFFKRRKKTWSIGHLLANNSVYFDEYSGSQTPWNIGGSWS